MFFICCCFFPGVAAGSVAAGIQSVVYGGATTGLFSVAQSAGVVGLGAASSVVVATAGAVLSSIF